MSGFSDGLDFWFLKSVGPLFTLPARIVPLSVPHPSLPALTVQARRNTTPSFKPCFTPLHTYFSQFPEFYFQLSHFASPLTAPVQPSRRFPFGLGTQLACFQILPRKHTRNPFASHSSISNILIALCFQVFADTVGRSRRLKEAWRFKAQI